MNKAEIRAALQWIQAPRPVEEQDEAAALILAARFLSEVERLTAAKKITRKALAERVGTSASYITQLFRGDRLLNLTMAARLQRVLEIEFHLIALTKAQLAAGATASVSLPTPPPVPRSSDQTQALDLPNFLEKQVQDGGRVETDFHLLTHFRTTKNTPLAVI